MTENNTIHSYVVARDNFKTVIAGYPWFLDWGRDTFIVMRGMIAAGLHRESLDIIRKFGAFEQDGTLPNMICGADASNRDTSDAPLWYIVAVRDLCKACGDEILNTDCGNGRSVRDVVSSIIEGYMRGTPNGIKMDPETGLVYSPAHFTWMDTNHPAGTPREGYPIEIQALWVAALEFAEKVGRSRPGKPEIDFVKQSIIKHYVSPQRDYLSDCLHVSACRDGDNQNTGCFAPPIPDDHLRPNQLFAITLGAVTDREICAKILRSCATLLIPGAIRTLAPQPVKHPLPVWRDGVLLNDPNNPYWGRYSGDEDTRRKPAYHNGTAWAWVYPSYAEALFMTYGESAREAARAYISADAAHLRSGCVGHIAEIFDGDAPHAAKGCDAQAWSDSEFLRVKLLLR